MSLGVVVIGAGDMGRRHAQHWQAAGAKLIAVCDPDLERAQSVANSFGALALVNPDEAFMRDDVELVSVCTPTFLHARYSIQALEAGKHVLCEKPAALTLADALAMQQAASKHQRQLRIGFMRRFDPLHSPLLAAYAQLGSPVLAQTSIVAGIRPKLLMHDAQANGGPIIDMCCHVFDLWAQLFGASPVSVSAQGYTFAEDKAPLAGIQQKAIDSSLFSLSYPNACSAQFQISWGLPASVGFVEEHSYVGPLGHLQVAWNKGMTLRTASGTLHWQSSGADPWRAEIEQYYLELREQAEHKVASIDDGIAALRISLAVLQSVQSGQSVVLDELADVAEA